MKSKAIQVSSNGFRDGSLGDDTPPDSAEESVQIHLLSQTLVHLFHDGGDRLTPSRDSQHVASTGSLFHIPPVVLPPAHLLRMVARLCSHLLLSRQTRFNVYLRAFPSRITGCFSNSILRGGPTAWSGNRRSARAQKTARAICSP